MRLPSHRFATLQSVFSLSLPLGMESLVASSLPATAPASPPTQHDRWSIPKTDLFNRPPPNAARSHCFSKKPGPTSRSRRLRLRRRRSPRTRGQDNRRQHQANYRRSEESAARADGGAGRALVADRPPQPRIATADGLGGSQFLSETAIGYVGWWNGHRGRWTIGHGRVGWRH